MGKMLGWILWVLPRTKPVTYFWPSQRLQLSKRYSGKT